MLKSYKIYTCTNGTLGLHLSRAPWDPYPWVSSIQKESTSYQAGLRIGDCLLELNGQDVLGMKISEIAALLKNHWLNESSNYVTVVIWRNKCNNGSNKKHSNNVSSSEEATTNACNEGDCDGDDDDDEDEENNAHNINQQSLQKFATCLQHIAQLLECPVCLEVIKPPGWQCCNGHVLCNNCRSRSEKCPVCRVPLGPRGRCLLSDKLFTLLADSFPCDGVRSNKTSPKDRRKCSTEFHNQPKMAIIQKQQQQEQQQEKDEHQQQGAKKAKDFLLTSLRNRRRKISTTKIIQNTDNSENLQRAGIIKKEENEDEQQHENKHLSIQKQVMYDTNTVVVVTSGMNNRKSSLDYTRVQQLGDLNDTEGVVATTRSSVFCNELLGQTATIQQCHCITCRYKPDKLANVNNVTTTPVLRPQNKYILRITSQEQQEKKIVLHQQYKEKYQNYQCPTGKLCCLNVNMMPHDATCTTTTATIIKNINNENVKPFQINSMTNRNLSTENIATAQQINDFNFTKTLKNEWEILAHLTEDHKLPVQQYYALYGQRIYLHCLSQQNVITCLNLKGSNEPDSKIEKFFIVCMPLEMTSNINAIPTKVALYVYHMNALTNNTATTTTSPITSTSLDDDDGDAVVVDVDEVSNFETIIENPLTGIKWFGQAHPLTTPWSHIFEKQHFLEYNVATRHHTCATQITADNSNGSSDGASSGDNAFVIVVKRKLEMKTKI